MGYIQIHDIIFKNLDISENYNFEEDPELLEIIE